MNNNQANFVEKYYPNYHHCNEVLKNSDLQILVDGNAEQDTQAYDIYLTIKQDLLDNDLSSWCGSNEDLEDIILQQASVELVKSNEILYAKSIEAFMQKNDKEVYFLLGVDACELLSESSDDELVNS